MSSHYLPYDAVIVNTLLNIYLDAAWFTNVSLEYNSVNGFPYNLKNTICISLLPLATSFSRSGQTHV